MQQSMHTTLNQANAKLFSRRQGAPVPHIKWNRMPHGTALKTSGQRPSRPSIAAFAAKRTDVSRTSPERMKMFVMEDNAAASSEKQGWWASVPARYKLVAAASMSFVICNMDKVNMSVAIIPMAHDFGWSPTISGVVHSAFFWGYFFAQLPSGYIASVFGGRKLLPSAVVLFSGATAAMPMLASIPGGLFLARSAVGFGVGFAPGAATDIVARIVPKPERSRAVSFIFSGLHIGSIIGLLAAPALIHVWGWQSLFITFGLSGFVWSFWFEHLMESIQSSEPEVTERLDGMLRSQSVSEKTMEFNIPWRGFLRSTAVRALMYTHFCNNWFHYTMLAWLPTYLTYTLNVDLTHAATIALLPPVAGFMASAAAGPAADALITRGVAVPIVRKLAQSVAFVLPSILLGIGCVSEDSVETIAAITIALGLSSFSLAGLYCTHADLSPKYASAMLGLTNTAGTIPGILGVATVGYLFDGTQSWATALFAPSAFFCLTGAMVYVLWGRNEPEDFENNDEPFAFEERLRLPWK